ncbi:hypothetical protein MRX96_029135 [Rhipicephalus microplus]
MAINGKNVIKRSYRKKTAKEGDMRRTSIIVEETVASQAFDFLDGGGGGPLTSTAADSGALAKAPSTRPAMQPSAAAARRASFAPAQAATPAPASSVSPVHFIRERHDSRPATADGLTVHRRLYRILSTPGSVLGGRTRQQLRVLQPEPTAKDVPWSVSAAGSLEHRHAGGAGLLGIIYCPGSAPSRGSSEHGFQQLPQDGNLQALQSTNADAHRRSLTSMKTYPWLQFPSIPEDLVSSPKWGRTVSDLPSAALAPIARDAAGALAKKSRTFSWSAKTQIVRERHPSVSLGEQSLHRRRSSTDRHVDNQ